MPKHNFPIQTHVNDFLNLLAQREFELANYLRGRYEDLRDIMSHYRAVKQLECQGAEYLKDFYKVRDALLALVDRFEPNCIEPVKYQRHVLIMHVLTTVGKVMEKDIGKDK